MTDPKRSHGPLPVAPPSAPPPADALARSPLTNDQVHRWAAMIAAGKTVMPDDDVAVEDRERLAKEVRRLLRDQLINLIARAIARDIERDRMRGHGGLNT